MTFWKNVLGSKPFLVLGSILTVTSSSVFIADLGTCPNRKLLSSMATSSNFKKRMTEWAFGPNQALLQLPMDPEKENFVRREVPRAVFSEVYPTPFQSKPQLICASPDALENLLEMHSEEMPKDEDFVAFVAGNKVIKGSIPLSHRYGGYQFGYWASQLGDGRAILLGEYTNEKGQRTELQLKGAGKTPYSRFGDGRAVLRSSIREFLCSEAMHYLGIPTSRAAALVVSEDTVMRDIFYDGRAKPEKCAVVLRLAPTWFRIGSLEILAKSSETKELNQLIDFILENHFQHVKQEKREDWIVAMFANIVDSTATLVAKWMSVGFTHGVLNTDNLSLASITIDYGPFGFMDAYDPNYVPNHSDDSGRYDFESQPSICLWNLGKLATALTSILPHGKHQDLHYVIGGFNATYEAERLRLFSLKLGLSQGSCDKDLIDALFEAFFASSADFNQSFRDMSETNIDEWMQTEKWGLAKLSKVKKFKTFLDIYKQRLGKENVSETTRMQRMQASNPKYILRNWMAQLAIEKAEKGDFSVVHLLLKTLTNPFVENKDAEKMGFSGPVPDWSRDLVVSCSS